MTHLLAQIPAAETQLAALAALEPKLTEARRFSDLRKIEAAHPQLQARQTAETHAAILPYRVFYYQGFEIRVGKNARGNDALTFGHSRASDLWLHARGVAGSHVILRRSKSQSVPRPVREYAASLAAGHSQAQHSGLVPVIVTSRKFVRKNKRMAPGQVIVSREEEVLLVPPRKG
jgi:predicted ribosome quality control (RQC) complex YloA/Tae2 family protein